MFSAWRHTIIENADMASIWLNGLEDTNDLSAADRLRFDLAFTEMTWAHWQLWDRARAGVIDRLFEASALELVKDQIESSATTRQWWDDNKMVFGADFSVAVEAYSASSRRPGL